jgi:ABC-type uncharacterized transport system permease subunit
MLFTFIAIAVASIIHSLLHSKLSSTPFKRLLLNTISFCIPAAVMVLVLQMPFSKANVSVYSSLFNSTSVYLQILLCLFSWYIFKFLFGLRDRNVKEKDAKANESEVKKNESDTKKIESKESNSETKETEK